MLKLLLTKTIYLAAKYLPKFNWLVLQTYPIWEDNGVAVYLHLKNEKVTKIIWLIPDKLEFIPFETKIKPIFLKRNSIKAICYYIFSRYIFITHGLYFRKFPKNQISVNMWHGMPIKSIGIEKGKTQLITTFTLSTSDYYSKILSETFNVPLNTILNIGLPRNTRLFAEQNSVKRKLNINSKLIIWLPTYRVSIEGDIRTDGIDYGNAFNMPDFDITKFNLMLEKLDMICLLKPHPMAQYKDVQELGRIMIINDNWLYNKSLTLYETLSICDLLISDVSSVIIDFLLLNRPIAIAFPDKLEYEENRGLAIANFYENAPGPLCQTQKEIDDYLFEIANGTDKYFQKRQRLKSLFHNEVSHKYFFEELDKIIQ